MAPPATSARTTASKAAAGKQKKPQACLGLFFRLLIRPKMGCHIAPYLRTVRWHRRRRGRLPSARPSGWRGMCIAAERPARHAARRAKGRRPTLRAWRSWRASWGAINAWDSHAQHRLPPRGTPSPGATVLRMTALRPSLPLRRQPIRNMRKRQAVTIAARPPHHKQSGWTG